MASAEGVVYGGRMIGHVTGSTASAVGNGREHTLGVGAYRRLVRLLRDGRHLHQVDLELIPWTIACWRGLVGGLLITAYVLWRSGREAASASTSAGAAGRWSASACSPSLGFIAAFKYTYVANVAIIYASVPLMAAALEWAVPARPSERSRTIGDGASSASQASASSCRAGSAADIFSAT